MVISFKPDSRSDTDIDVVGFGTNAVDFLINVPEYPAYNSKIELSNYVEAAGGEIATTTAGLCRLGLRTAYIGRFGDDAAAEIGIGSLEREGVDLTYIQLIPGASTQIAFIVIDERTGERTVIWKRDAKLAYTEADAPLEAARRCRVLHITPHDTAACIAMAKAAREAGAKVSIDIDNLFEGVEDLLPLVDIFVSSADFPVRLTGIEDLRSSLTLISERYGCEIACATLGDAGSLLLADSEFIETAGFPVPGGCKDTTGAGDAFRAGLLYGLLTENTVAESARIANAVASLKCRAVGARTALPTPDELTAFLK